MSRTALCPEEQMWENYEWDDMTWNGCSYIEVDGAVEVSGVSDGARFLCLRGVHGAWLPPVVRQMMCLLLFAVPF